MAVDIIRYDRFGNMLGHITDIVRAEWTEELDGNDTVELESLSEVNKGDRLVWRDGFGAWHEHTVYSVERTHEQYGIWRVFAENSIAELRGDFILDKRPNNQTAYSALAMVLSGAASERSNSTRWACGSVTVSGTNSATFYRESVYDCIQDILDIWGGEISTTINVTGSNVTNRYVNITRRGSDKGRRFEYGHNVSGITRTYNDADVITALYGFGKGEQVGEGYSRRIDFSSCGSTSRASGVSHVYGDMFVQSNSAKATWGRPNAAGVKQHVFGKVELDDYEDKAELMNATMDELERLCVPDISYEAGVLDFIKAGYEIAGAQIGDDVRIIDTVEGFEVRATGRVSKAVRDMLDDSALVALTIGSIRDCISDRVTAAEQALRKLGSRSAAWDTASYVTTDYLERVMDGFNVEFEQGGVYKYETFENGTIYSSVPLDEHLKPTTTPAKAIQLKGGGFRISNTVDASGNFVWTTAADGSGITANVMNAGVIRGGNSWWNLESGDMYLKGQIEATSGKIGGFTIGSTSIYSVKSSLDSTASGVYIGHDGIAVGYGSLGMKVTKEGSGSFSGNITSSSGNIGGFMIGSSSIYSGKSSLTSNTSGVYVGNNGISTGSGTSFTGLYGGYLQGGNSGSVTGYVGFNNYYIPTGIYGARLAGKGSVAIFTDGPFGVGSYVDSGSYGYISTGVTRSLSYISDIWDDGGGSIGWETTTIQFVHGLLNST